MREDDSNMDAWSGSHVISELKNKISGSEEPEIFYFFYSDKPYIFPEFIIGYSVKSA